MSRKLFLPSRWHGRVFRVGITCFCLLGWLYASSGQEAHAQAAVSVNGIEEDWELVIDTPDPNLTGPQITCSIAPVAGDDSLYGAFELNHRSLPDFARGGMQLQVWSGAYNLANNPYPQNQILNTSGETVTWTCSMRLNGGSLTFEIKGGNSSTWGTFGGQGYMRSAQTCSVSDLNAYSPEDSVENSGVGYASNRVQSLTLKRVRYYLSNGSVVTDSSPRVVHILQ